MAHIIVWEHPGKKTVEAPSPLPKRPFLTGPSSADRSGSSTMDPCSANWLINQDSFSCSWTAPAPTEAGWGCKKSLLVWGRGEPGE